MDTPAPSRLKASAPEAPSAIVRLREIMAKLRSPGGCPWDADQTPQTLRPYIIEEAYELVEAISSGNKEKIKDELGDLLLQVVFQARIFEEAGDFGFDDVATGISEKLVRRHPHVFEGTTYTDASELHRQWDAIKRQERAATREDSSILAGLSTALPSLMKAEKILTRIDRANFQPPLNATLYGKVEKLCQDTGLTDNLGELMLCLVEYARQNRCNAEMALGDACNRLKDEIRKTENSGRDDAAR